MTPNEIRNEVDEEWLNEIAKHWNRSFGKHFEECTEHNIAKVFEVIRELHSELTALKTAHCCDECHWFSNTEEYGYRCNHPSEVILEICIRDKPWPCGLFKEKGTQ